jgi:F420-dependent oxidoreductase-like protein
VRDRTARWHAGGVRISIWPGAYQPYESVLAAATHAERTGWDGVWFADHFMANAGGAFPPESPTLEAGTMVAALAASVPRVRIGTLVLGNTYRHPAVVANMAATVDRISGGRFTLGLGAGWQVNEHEQYGITLPSVRERVDRFAEAVQVIRSLLREPTTSFEGTHYRLSDALCEPKPVQDPLPILIGASGEQRMLGLVARYAEQWNTWGVPDHIKHKMSVMDEHCERVGRDPAAIRRTAQALVHLTPDQATADAITGGRQPVIAGTAARLGEIFGEYAGIGLDELIVPDMTLGTGSQRDDAMDALYEAAAPYR